VGSRSRVTASAASAQCRSRLTSALDSAASAGSQRKLWAPRACPAPPLRPSLPSLPPPPRVHTPPLRARSAPASPRL
jgi:hypothetical protein